MPDCSLAHRPLSIGKTAIWQALAHLWPQTPPLQSPAQPPNPHRTCGAHTCPKPAGSFIGDFRTPAPMRAVGFTVGPASETLHTSGSSMMRGRRHKCRRRPCPLSKVLPECHHHKDLCSNVAFGAPVSIGVVNHCRNLVRTPSLALVGPRECSSVPTRRFRRFP